MTRLESLENEAFNLVYQTPLTRLQILEVLARVAARVANLPVAEVKEAQS